jgi:hypothetical protein
MSVKNRLLGKEDVQVFAALEGIREAYRRDIRPSDDDLDIVMAALDYAVLPPKKTRGRLRGSTGTHRLPVTELI